MTPNFSLKYNEEEYNLGTGYEFEPGVTVGVKVREFKEFDAVEWVLYFENKSDKKSGIFSEICDSNVNFPFNFPKNPRPGYMPKTGDACVITMNGAVDGSYYTENDKVSATEYSFNLEYLDKSPDMTKKFGNITGRSSDGLMPFFDITASGRGYITAIGWTGDWMAEFSKNENGIKMKTGLKETGFYLNPGEKIRTSSTLIMKYEVNEDKHNKFRSLIKKHFSHKSENSDIRDGLMAVELWGGLHSEEMVKRLKEYKKYDIKFEDIWIDAGWYGNCTKCDEAFSGDWFKFTGDWYVNKRVHPGELLDVKAAAADMGANLMLWFEPERAIEGTSVTKEHPEWFLTLPGDVSKILYYGNEDAFNHILNTISYYVEKLDMSCYRQDFNVGLTEYFKAYDEEGRRGITEIKHIMGLYRLWDTLHEKYPNLLIDNCSSGGRRFDIETLRRSIAFFRSDYQCAFNENPEVLQAHNSNLSCYLPYAGCTSKTKNDDYAIRSSYSSSWGGAFYNAVFQSMDENDFRWAKKITDEYLSIRKYMSKDFYNLLSNTFDDTSWTVWQYHDKETESGILIAFRKSNSPFDTVTVNLKGLKDGTYIFKNFDDLTIRESGKEFKITLPEKRQSVIFEYKIK